MEKNDELMNKINELNMIKVMATYGSRWCKKNKKDFLFNLKFTDKGCFTELGFFDKNMKNEEVMALIDGLLQNDEMAFLNRMYTELNELGIGLTEEESLVVQKLQDKIEVKFMELKKIVFDEN